MKIDPIKFGQDLNQTIIGLEVLTSSFEGRMMIGDPTIIQGMQGFLATVQGITTDPVAWPKLVAYLNGLSP